MILTIIINDVEKEGSPLVLSFGTGVFKNHYEKRSLPVYISEDSNYLKYSVSFGNINML